MALRRWSAAVALSVAAAAGIAAVPAAHAAGADGTPAAPTALPTALPTQAPTSTTSSRPLPTQDPFYRYTGATPLRQIAPGTVLKTRTVPLSLGGTTSPLTAEQILYRTTSEIGRPEATVTTVINPTASLLGGLPTSGTAPTLPISIPTLAPLKPNLPVPTPTLPTTGVTRVVAYLSFYDALGSECDPSYTLAGGYPGNSSNQQQAEEEEALIASYVAQGNVVTIPDYEGENLDWAAGQESGMGTLDGIKATESALHLPRTTPVGLSGYSGGSIAADWASELQPKYAPKLHIVGVAEGGIPVDFDHNLTYINGSPVWSSIIPAVLKSLTRAFHVPLNKYLSPYGVQLTNQVKDECIGSFLGSYPGLTVQKLLKPQYQDFTAIPEFRKIINYLIMGTTVGHPLEPLYMAVGDADGTGDDIMVTKDVQALAHEYCTQGVPTTFQVFDKADHDNSALLFEPNASAFLQQRFAGVPDLGESCAAIGQGNSLAPVQ